MCGAFWGDGEVSLFSLFPPVSPGFIPRPLKTKAESANAISQVSYGEGDLFLVLGPGSHSTDIRVGRTGGRKLASALPKDTS